ncbi:hypothetical protein, partial [uncultured Thiocystis sp.]|uniref:hypothetical protein n=1 Tax=uncultured Thiocystis sp. TaxID=1202134 RepID=UPI0025CDFC09
MLRNLLDRDLLGFMRVHVTFAAKPTKDAIGQAVPGAPLSTRRGYEKRCDRFLAEADRRYHDIPVQELLSWLPVLGETLAVNTTYDQALVKQLFGDGNPGFTLWIITPNLIPLKNHEDITASRPRTPPDSAPRAR